MLVYLPAQSEFYASNPECPLGDAVDETQRIATLENEAFVQDIVGEQRGDGDAPNLGKIHSLIVG